MQGETTVVIPGVRIVHVETEGAEITADVFGGDGTVVVAEVVFRLDDTLEHLRLLHTFVTWERNARPLTLVQGRDGVVTLVDESGAFDSALG